MATYLEISDIAQNNGALLSKIMSAVVVQADVIRQESGATANHANRLIWAKGAFADPTGTAKKMIWALVAQNASATAAQITGATDASILTAVAAAVDVFATGA